MIVQFVQSSEQRLVRAVTWLGRSAGGCRPCAGSAGVCVRSAAAHTCRSGGCWSGRAPVGCCCSLLIGWTPADSPAYWPMRSDTAD